MGVMKTPGVYIVEKNAFPNSVVEVATAVPAFIGYTEKADDKGKSLTNIPKRITSLAEYQRYFGNAPPWKFTLAAIPKPGAEVKAPAAPASPAAPGAPAAPATPVPTPTSQAASLLVGGTAATNGDKYSLMCDRGTAGGDYLLYLGMLHFFQNGGGPCYIVSVGNYGGGVDFTSLANGIAALVREQEPTMVVIPDAVRLDDANCYNLQKQMLMHCGMTMRNRVAVLDVWGGDQEPEDAIGPFRNNLGTNQLSYGAAYYPWLNTTLVQDNDLSFRNVKNDGNAFLTAIAADMGVPAPAANPAGPVSSATTTDNSGGAVTTDAITNTAATPASSAGNTEKTALTKVDPKQKEQQALFARVTVAVTAAQLDDDERVAVHNSLLTVSGLYKSMVLEMKRLLNVMPPSAAMAGIYTMVDNTRGVWKAPANVSLNGVISPTVQLSSEEQEDLNVTPQGKSVNAIRTFIGEGVLVWGARTLDGNSLDWRYVNVRRTMIMLEESCRLAAKALVFEPNVANTWVTMRSMIGNFLTGVWKRGGLAGATPEDAFSVHVGLGETMTPDDILEGILRVTVLVAISRPAEFIEITFQQQMQKS